MFMDEGGDGLEDGALCIPGRLVITSVAWQQQPMDWRGGLWGRVVGGGFPRGGSIYYSEPCR